MNQIGMAIQKIYATNYLPSDFKKNSGYQRSIELCKEYDVYRQCYCGCPLAIKQQGCKSIGGKVSWVAYDSSLKDEKNLLSG